MEARDRVNEYLHLHVGHLVRAGDPVFDAGSRVWRVPVLAHTHLGVLPVGEIKLGDDLTPGYQPSKAEVQGWIRRAIQLHGTGDGAPRPGPEVERAVPLRAPLSVVLDAIDRLSPDELRQVARRAEARLAASAAG